MEFKSNKYISQVQDAQMALSLARLAMKTTGFDGKQTISVSNAFLEELDSAKSDVITELVKLDQLYHHLDEKRQERDDNIAIAEQELVDFIKVQDDHIVQLQTEYENKIQQTEETSVSKIASEKKEAETTISQKQKDKEKKIAEAEKNRERQIKIANKGYEDRIKEIEKELGSALKGIDKDKKKLISQAEKGFSAFQKSIEQKSKEVNKSKERLAKSRSRAKDAVDDKKAELLVVIKNQKIEYGVHRNRLNDMKIEEKTGKEELKEKIIEYTSNAEKEVKNKENWADEERTKTKEKLDLIISEQNKLVDDLKGLEKDVFDNLKTKRATSMADLRSEQRRIFLKLNEEKDETIVTEEQKVSDAKEEKKKETKSKIESINVEYADYRSRSLLGVLEVIERKIEKLDDTLADIETKAVPSTGEE